MKLQWETRKDSVTGRTIVAVENTLTGARISVSISPVTKRNMTTREFERLVTRLVEVAEFSSQTGQEG